MNNENEELFIPKTKHKFLKIFFAILLIGAIGIGGYFLYQEKFNNPKNIVKNILENDKMSFETILNNDNKVDKYKINGIMKIDANLDEESKSVTDIIKNIDLQFSGEIDTTNSIANVDINTKYKDEKLLDLNMYYEKNIAYLLLKDVYDKYLKLNNKQDNIDETLKEEITKSINDLKININDIKVIINSLGNAFKEEIMNYDFKQESIVITIDGKEQSVLNNYVILKNNDFYKLASDIIKNISNDKDVISALNNLLGQDSKIFLTTFSNELNKNNFVGTYRINFYTDKNIFNKKLISLRQEITQNNITTLFNIDKIQDGIIISTNTLGISYGIKIVRNSSNFNLEINMGAMEMNININISMNYEKIDEVKKVDVSKNKDIDKLTEEEKKQIEEKLSNNEALKKIINKIKDNKPNLNI